MAVVRRVHTAELRADELGRVRRLLDDAFGDDFTDADWDNTLGGLHTLVVQEGEIVGHVAVVQRRLLYRERWLRTGYVEGLAVRSDRRRRGLATAAMTEAERIIDRSYQLGGLCDGSGISGFYQRRGWLHWTGPTFVVTRDGMLWTPEETMVMVRVTPMTPDPALDVSEPLGCDPRRGDAW
jgi:aminoglycoside 2'-N-acetyltransferase I